MRRSVRDFASLLVLAVSRRGKMANLIDEELARLDLTRRVVASVPTERAAFEFVRGCDLLVTMPESSARAAASTSASPCSRCRSISRRRRCICPGINATTATSPTPGCETSHRPRWLRP
ncbi:hypothetical protein ACFXNW_18585 [Nocardia sp. NPDC059180]|uniref:hypothetical protein n=1 Tax=Nocardia sp. NPDC059180 TaxID=3346761 RepID=UPI003692D64F